MIRIYTITDRIACLDFAERTPADIAAYDANVEQYYNVLCALARQDDIDLTIDEEGQSVYTYTADTDAEHQWYQECLPYWEWYQAGMPIAE